MNKTVKVLTIGLGIALALGACAAETKADVDAPKATKAKTEAPATTAAPKPSKGLGTKDASADVGKPTLDAPDVIGVSYVHIPVTNNSSKRSDYFIDVAIESADGATQYESTIAPVLNLEPGQSATAEAMVTTEAPAGATARVTGVQRTASL